MKAITTQQIIKFNTLLRNLNLEEDHKRGIIASFTNGRTDRTNDMHFIEAHAMIAHLAKLAGQTPLSSRRGAGGEARRVAEDKMRKKVIAIAYQLGWTLPNGKLDYNRLNTFIATHPVSPRKECTELNHHNYNELVLLITQFESILKKHLNQFKK
jgi:hypothetical protein